jgi:hypothetical protein
MTELDLLNLGRSITDHYVTWLGQVITINFAMVVGIYYFLHRAHLGMKLFAFAAYTVGIVLYYCEILLESNIKAYVIAAQEALPQPSAITQEYVAVAHSWLGILTAVLFNGAFWILWLGVLYLLFFWRRGEDA